MEKPPQSLHVMPEDLHSQGVAREVLGREVVLGHDFKVGHALVRDAADARVEEMRRSQPQDEPDRHPILDYTPEERQAAIAWRDALTDHLAQRPGDQVIWGEASLIVGLESVRYEVSRLNTERHGKNFDALFDVIAPRFLRQQVHKWSNENPDIETGRWLTWLARPGSRENDEQLLNFLQWHNHHVEKLQEHPTFQEVLTRKEQEYGAAVEQAEQTGWLADGSSQRTAEAFEAGKISHFVADTFYAAKIHAAAYARYEDSTAYAPGYGIRDLQDSVEENAFHEFNHAALGKLPSRWLNEAVTEHIAQVLEGGREVSNVYSDADELAYMPERDLLGTLIDMANELSGKHVVDIEDFTRAYSQGHTELKQAGINALRGKLKQSFGFSILGGIAGFLLQVERKSEKESTEHSRDQQAKALEQARHILAQQPHKFKDYLPQFDGQAA